MNDLFPKSRRRQRKSPHARTTETLLRSLMKNGLTLEQCGDAKVMGRSMYTLKKYARRFRLAFPDYVPRKLRRRKS